MAVSQKLLFDARILGNSSFVEAVLREDEQQKKYLSLSDEQKWNAFDRVLKQLCTQFHVDESELFGGSRIRRVSEVRRLLSYAGCRGLGLTAAQISRSSIFPARAS